MANAVLQQIVIIYFQEPFGQVCLRFEKIYQVDYSSANELLYSRDNTFLVNALGGFGTVQCSKEQNIFHICRK